MENFKPDTNFINGKDVETKIGKFIFSSNCEQLRVDLSAFNLFDALRLAILCSTKHYLKYQNGKIILSLKDEATRNIITPLKLKNMVFEVKNKEKRWVS